MSELPSFERPPVKEVVIAARFKRADRYSILTLGKIAKRMEAAGFSKIEEQPSYEAPVEEFGSTNEQSRMSLQLLPGPVPIRYWFSSDAGDELLQLQSNWFAVNWKKTAPSAEYKRWRHCWDDFQHWLTVVSAAISAGELDFDQVEVTYINHIDPDGVWTHHGEATRVFTALALTQGEFLGVPEQYSLNSQYLIRADADEGTASGRLHVSINPGFRRPEGTPIFVMNLTARGGPTGPGIEGIQGFAEVAHEWIVRGFTDLTCDAMHDVWQRIR
ncbi:MAG: TIGR04255 family protein [Acidimicrobiaceae bacterium]|nr:TIGR04255 family protein [Acidimicrobiia bacterium]MCY4493344.1 TIGR04255 family protein [Acidimicrobiaceae bacterium]